MFTRPDNLNLIYLGKFADLDPIESIPIGTAVPLGSANENEGALRGVTLNALSVVNLRSTDIQTGGGVFDNYEQWPNAFQGISADVFYNVGNGEVRTKLDASFYGNVTLTLADGSVRSNVFVKISQTEAGDLFIANTQGGGELNGLAIRSVTFNLTRIEDNSALWWTETVTGATAVGGNQAPVFTNIGDGQTISIPENTTFVVDANASDGNNDPLTFSIVGGADAARFTINPSTGVLAFVSAVDFEGARSATGNDQIYDVVVRVADGRGGFQDRTLFVNVTDVNEVARDGTVNGTSGNDTMNVGFTDGQGDVIDGPDGLNDRIDAGAGNDSIEYGLGDNVVFGGAGDDIIDDGPLSSGRNEIFGGDGNDTIFDGGGVDVVDGGAGNDRITGDRGGNDTFAGGDGNDTIDGGAGADVLRGDAGNDSVIGGDGNDSITAGWGDTVRGGNDADTIVINTTVRDANGATAAAITVDGGAGGVDADVLDLRGAGNWRIVNQTVDSNGNGTNGTVQFLDANGNATGQVLTFTEIESILGTAFVPANTAPVFTNLANGQTISIPENTTFVVDADATDANGDPLTFSIVGGADAARFTINPGTGVLAFVSPVDFEGARSAVGNDQIYDVIVRVADGRGGFQDRTLSVNVTDVFESGRDGVVNGTAGNDVIPVNFVDAQGDEIDGSDGVNDIVDAGAGNDIINSGAGNDTVFGGTGNDFVFSGDGNDSLLGGDGSDGLYAGNGADILDGGNGNDTLSGGAGNDRIVAGAGDSALGGADADTFVVNRNLRDSNNTTTAAITVDGGATGVDADVLDLRDAGNWRIVNQTPDSNGNGFNGTVQFLDAAGNQTGQQLTFTEIESILGTAFVAPNAPPTFSNVTNGQTINVAENTTFVVDANATDPEGDALTFAVVGGADAARFTVDPATGVLSFLSAPDFEGENSASGDDIYDVVLRVSDGRGGQRDVALNVNVTDVNEAPILANLIDGQTVSIDENTTFVVDADASDPEGDALTFAVVGGADAARFTVDPATGVLSFLSAPDFEGQNSASGDDIYDVVLRVSDGRGGQRDVALNVNVTDVNEAPTFSNVTDGQTINVDENTTFVVDADATDPEGDALTFAIVNGADAARFTVDAATGVLSFLSAPDFEGENSASGDDIYDVVLRVSDGRGGQRDVALNVNVTDVNEAPILANLIDGQTVSIDENTTFVVDADASDPEGDALTFAVVGGADAARFTVDAATGVLSFISAPDFEGENSASGDDIYEVTLRVSDGRGGAQDVTLNVEVIDVLEADGKVDGTPDDDNRSPGFFDGDGDIIDGADGDDDRIVVEAGNDVVDAGLGNDTVEGGLGNDSLSGGAGRDILIGGADDDSLSGGEGDDTLFGDDGSDTLDGDAGSDLLEGGEGADRINGGDDADTLFGGSADDTLSGNDGDDVVAGGDGNDQAEGDLGDDLISGDDGDDTLSGGSGRDTLDGGDGLDVLFGGDEDDVGRGGAGDDIAFGGLGNDTLLGADGADSLFGDDGDDVLDSRGLSERTDVFSLDLGSVDADPLDDVDFVLGGDGNDLILTGDDADEIQGGSGNDTVDAGIDSDLVFGGGDDDLIIAGEGSDTVEGGEGDDLIYGGVRPGEVDSFSVDDLLDLAPDNDLDSLDGGAGNDTIFGGDDADLLFGGAGDDVLDGGLDNDWIDGGTGSDVATGGAGADVFVFTAGSQLTVTDFSVEDQLLLVDFYTDLQEALDDFADDAILNQSFGDFSDNLAIDGSITLIGADASLLTTDTTGLL